MILNENDSKEYLKAFGIDRPQYLILDKDDTRDQDIVFSSLSMDYPLVVKILGDDLAHKSDSGGVIKDVSNPEDLIHSVENMKREFPDTSLLIEEQVSHNAEFILGIKKDPLMGYFIMFGAGGILTELYQDVVFRKIPVAREDIETMLESTNISAFFKGFRGKQYDPNMLIEPMLKMSEHFEKVDRKIIVIDINPAVIKGEGLIALDAKIEII